MKYASLTIAIAALLAVAGPAQAQNFPSRPIRIVNGYTAGGASDLYGRIMAKEMEKRLGVAVTVENHPGASGTVAGRIVAAAAPDGYTLTHASIGQMSINFQLMDPPPYDPMKDFEHISLAGTYDQVLVVNASFPVKTLAELVDLEKRNPGKYFYATSGAGGSTHLTAELFKKVAGVNMVHVPFKGDSQALDAVMAGEVPMQFANSATVVPQMNSGKLRVIGILSPKRMRSMPNVPTFEEAGYPGFTAALWTSMEAPAGTPPAVVNRLSDVIQAIHKQPDFIKSVEALGANAVASTPQEAAKFIQAEINKWHEAIMAAGMPKEKASG